MSFLDSLKNQAMAYIPGGDSPIVQAALSGIEQQGGLSALSQRFHEEGLGGVINSWVSSGPNHAISADQIQKVIGSDRIAQIASRFGIPADEVAGKIAETLPAVVDRMTPGGRLPQ